jgi:hypothetical protein
MKEQFSYRARKWLLRQVSSNRHATQHRKIINNDWDILIILDACRAGVLKSVANWPVETVVSPASCTPEWISEMESYGILDNKIVSANPQYEKLDVDVESYYDTHWNDQLSTVLPEPVLNRVNKLADDDMKVIAHLQQPHWPYVAKFGESWKLAYSELGPWDSVKGEIEAVQVAMARGHIDLNKARQAYLASVKSIWSTLVPYVNQWTDQSLTTVITADHGETFGQFRDMKFYEHPCKCHISPLTNVPWIKIGPDRAGNGPESTVQNRLKALGYAE